MLSDSEDEFQNEELHKITINEHYAKAFQYRKEREELDKRMCSFNPVLKFKTLILLLFSLCSQGQVRLRYIRVRSGG